LRTYEGKLGVNTNNTAKLHALEEGFRISSTQGISKIIMEGDSQVIINFLNHMQYISPISKISNSWRMESILKEIQQTLHLISVIIHSHIYHSTNKMTDWLENETLETSKDEWDGPWIPLEDDGFSSTCSSIPMKDLPTLETGLRKQAR
jgi:ribonuclease HI